MKITVLGPGCAKCDRFAENVRVAVRELGLDAEVEKVSDINEITRHKILRTPGLAIDGELKVWGKVLGVEKIKQLLSAEAE
jgi:small redox-active disulfide protein 2